MQNDGAKILSDYEGGRLLKSWGLPVVESVLASNSGEVQAGVKQLRFPVALKVCSASIPHKTEKGGVVLNLRDAASLQKAADAMDKLFRGVPHSLLVQEMAPAGIELIAGAKRDPVFGPVVLVGLGGIFTEVMADAAIEIAPVDKPTALAMLARLRGAALLDGYRGQPAVNKDAVADVICALSQLIAKREDISEIDVNPLIVTADDAFAVDALVRIEGGGPAGAGKHPRAATVDPFFKPASIALIGASRSPGKGGNIILRNLVKAGFRGAVHPINPTAKEILGMKSYENIRDIPDPVDLAMFVIPKPFVAESLADCAAKGIKNIIISTGGYSDIGREGAAEQRAIMEEARKYHIRVMGPNSIGVLNPRHGLATSIVGLEPLKPGGVSIIGQSGVYSSGWGRWIADTKPFGVAKIACIGNKGDINESDLLEYLAADDETSTIGMYLEGVVDGSRFIKAAAKAARRKPVVAMKSGRTPAGAAAVASHTGSLAGSDGVFDAVCRRAGLIRVREPEGFFDSLMAFEKLPLPRGNRLGVASISGMGCVAATDAAEECGVILPALQKATLRKLAGVMPPWAPVRNPVDTWSAIEQHGSQKTMSHVTGCLMEQDDVDAVLIVFVLMPESIFNIKDAFASIISGHPFKPVLVSYYGGTTREAAHIQEGFAALNVPAYATPERAIHVFKRMVSYAEFRGIIRPER